MSNSNKPTLVGKKNVYTCAHGHKLVTVDAHDGTTPFIITCETPVNGKECGAPAQSAMYRVDQKLEATHEWYRPAMDRTMHHETRAHVASGGLLLRKIKKGT